MRITNTGRVGIGNGLPDYWPSSMLNVGLGANNVSIDDVGSARYNGGLAANNFIAGGGACIGFNAARQTDAAFACRPSSLGAASGSKNGGALIWADLDGTLNFTAFPSNGGTIGVNAPNAQYFFANDVLAYRVLKIKPTNQVQIGVATPTNHTDYRLAVDGKLVAKSIFVTQTPSWADFVFEPTYSLRSLPELEGYLKQHRHLPAIPSAAEVAKNGIDLGTMDARLLQSLEELTLHVIELGKQNAHLQAEVAALTARVNQAAAPAAGK
ncbi:hypothetical protein [Hymenobacter antarcticus]|uniref:Chaperone of endosialidase n=1 Tax=Hymenobacter antarcticus TaxID=486270 RepID=A0ABP7QTG9_9BACT